MKNTCFMYLQKLLSSGEICKVGQISSDNSIVLKYMKLVIIHFRYILEKQGRTHK